MSKQIFISHSTKDAPAANKMVKYLEDSGLTCFIAPRDIEGGKPYGLCLTENIRDCSLVVVIGSGNINGSEHVMNEIDLAVNNNKPIIPFLIQDFDMKDEIKYYLGRKQRIVATSGPLEQYFETLLDAISSTIPDIIQKTEEAPKDTMRVFEYIADRGIMINPVDRFRNVSFRSDTYVKFCSEMYNRIREISNDETAMESFFASGYNSGSSFGRRLEDQFSVSSRPLSTEEKIKRWCEFDSSVGWGKFRSTLTINEEEGTIDGFLTINECFIVDKIGKRKICQFIVGYCSGVLEQILNGVPVEIKCVGCPLNNRFKNDCKFEVKVKE